MCLCVSSAVDSMAVTWLIVAGLGSEKVRWILRNAEEIEFGMTRKR